MCTLACWIGVFPDAPLVVAANRDERLDRAADPPSLWVDPPVVAPRDRVAGGTWWALNQKGIFVALTNRAGAMIDPARRSRGLVVLDVAAAQSLDEAERICRDFKAEEYNGFHLLAATGQGAVRAVCDGRTLSVERLGTGFHLVSERSFGAAEVSRDAHVRELLAPLSEGPLDFARFEPLLRSHENGPFDSLCVHLDAQRYGTRSSTFLALGPARRELRFADGRPCTTAFRDLSALLGAR